MKIRIETALEAGTISDDTRKQHRGFSEWNLNIKKNDHQSIVQVEFQLQRDCLTQFFFVLLIYTLYKSMHIYKFIFSQILIDGRDTSAVDSEGSRLPTLVYMAREKRPNWPHNFKAGAMNALVSLLHFFLKTKEN